MPLHSGEGRREVKEKPSTADTRISFTDNLSRLQLLELDACTRCGECLNWCPVYEALRDKAITPVEKITAYKNFIHRLHGLRSVLAGPGEMSKEELEQFAEALYQCTTCGACGEACEVGIWTQRLWPTLREKMVQLEVGPIGPQRGMRQVVAEKHNPYGQPPEARNDWLPEGITVAPRAEVGYYVGCSGAYVAQPMVRGAVRVLQAAGVTFTLLDPEEEYCCGFPLYIIGERGLLAELVKHNVEAYMARGVRELVVSCPCCSYMIATHWPALNGGSLPFRVSHITQMVVRKLEEGVLEFRKPLRETITYHDPCYLSRGLGLTEAPRKVISRFLGARLVEMSRNRRMSRCCGAGGGIRRAYVDLSFDVSITAIKDAEGTGAGIMAISCPACYERLHLAMAIRNYETPMRIMDLMEIAASLLEEEDESSTAGEKPKGEGLPDLPEW